MECNGAGQGSNPEIPLGRHLDSTRLSLATIYKLDFYNLVKTYKFILRKNNCVTLFKCMQEINKNGIKKSKTLKCCKV